jgi:hypothetical protein
MLAARAGQVTSHLSYRVCVDPERVATLAHAGGPA